VIVVKYFELVRFDRRTKRLIPFKIASLEDFHSDRILGSRSFPAWRISVGQHSSEADVQISEHLESLLPRAQPGTLPIERNKQTRNETPFSDMQMATARKKSRRSDIELHS
jgi:hypothetical protein